MCRILVIMGSSDRLLGVRPQLVQALIRSSERDPHGYSLFGQGEFSHRDGWGFVRAVVSGEAVAGLYVGKSLKPFYEDDDARRLAEEAIPSGVAVAEMIHVRAASRGMPINIFSTHPAEAITGDGYRLFLIHNGTVDKKAILNRLGINPGSPYAEIYNDTFFLAQLMARTMDRDIDERVFEEAARYVKTALNIGLILVKDREIQVGVGSLYRGDTRERNYYRLYRSSIDGEAYIYSSSTLMDFYKPAGIDKLEEIPNGNFEAFRISGNKVEKIFSTRLSPI
jgi:glutamine amidotransferase